MSAGPVLSPSTLREIPIPDFPIPKRPPSLPNPHFRLPNTFSPRFFYFFPCVFLAYWVSLCSFLACLCISSCSHSFFMGFFFFLFPFLPSFILLSFFLPYFLYSFISFGLNSFFPIFLSRVLLPSYLSSFWDFFYLSLSFFPDLHLVSSFLSFYFPCMFIYFLSSIHLSYIPFLFSHSPFPLPPSFCRSLGMHFAHYPRLPIFLQSRLHAFLFLFICFIYVSYFCLCLPHPPLLFLLCLCFTLIYIFTIYIYSYLQLQYFSLYLFLHLHLLYILSHIYLT